jgi:hypothetical protein
MCRLKSTSANYKVNTKTQIQHNNSKNPQNRIKKQTKAKYSKSKKTEREIKYWNKKFLNPKKLIL